MKSILDRLDELQNTLQKLKPIKPEFQRELDKKIRLEFNYNSNHLEGNTLTYGETELLLIFDKTTGNHEMREYEEMKSHDLAFQLIQDWAQDKEQPLTESALKNLHTILLVRPFWNDALTPSGQPTRRLIKVGNYKEYPNSVRLQNGEIFEYASPKDTPILMGELIQWYRTEEAKKEHHPVVLAALLHYEFVRIHPFDDGNGRMARLLLNYVLLRHEFLPVIIKSADKKKYLNALNQADTGNTNAFIEYIANQLFWSFDIHIKAAKGESIEETDDLDKKIFLLKKKLGEDQNASIQLSYSDEAIEKVINDTIIPLGYAWEERLKSFDTLILSRDMTFSIQSKHSPNKIQSHTLRYFDNNLETLCKRIINSSPAQEEKISQITMGCHPKGLRNLINSISLNGGEISISFQRNTYEVTYTNNNIPLNKLYHQSLTQNEIDKIINDLGNFFYNVIEQVMETYRKKPE